MTPQEHETLAALNDLINGFLGMGFLGAMFFSLIGFVVAVRALKQWIGGLLKEKEDAHT